MGYTESLLASGERTVRRAHQHWFILIWNARWAVVSIVLAIALFVFASVSNTTGTLWTFLSYVTLVLFVIGLVSLVWGWFKFQNEEYLITTRRIIHAQGVVNKKATDSSLEKINDAVLTESVFGRIFGFGDLDVLTASESGIEKLRMLRDAKSFKKAMLEAKHDLELEMMRPTMPPLRSVPESASDEPATEEAHAEPAPAPVVAVPPAAPVAAAPPAPMTPDEVAEAMEQLGHLRDQGLITPADYDAKKAELLGRL